MKFTLISSLIILLLACSSLTQKKYTQEQKVIASKSVNDFFEKSFMESVARYPEFQTYLGIKTDYHLLDDTSEEKEAEELERSKKLLKELRSYDFEALNPATQISYRLFEEQLLEAINNYKYRLHNFPVNQMFGRHSGLPSFMINMHQIDTIQDARAYISRLNLFKSQYQEIIKQLELRRKNNIIAPQFVYPKAINDSQNMIKGKPFDKSKADSPLLADFKSKIIKLKLPAKERLDLLKNLHDALLTSVKPGFIDLIAKLQELEKIAPIEGSAASLPEGKKFYAQRLLNITTTNLSAEEIHQIGLDETKRIHLEMDAIIKKVKFEGSRDDFFHHMKTSRKFRYSDSPEGKKDYLKDTNAIISRMKKRLPEMFGTLPKASLTVKAVEPYREASAGLAFYQGPTEDGKRPGIYYVNLYDMNAVSKYEQEALAYHEALPGHHMQISISKELENLPKFRKHGGYTAYIEGWGLYAEYLPKEFGFYQDPYSDFGRLTMELWRAARLVVDTGLHQKKWTMLEAITWLDKNTPSTHEENIRAIQRYVVMPGQATAYKIGMNKILELREYAKKKLGAKFDLKAFHDLVLRDGALPLKVLEDKIKSAVP